MLKGKVVRVRWAKQYPAAHNHVAIGVVLDETSRYLALRCKTYHFKHAATGKKAKLKCGQYVGGIMESETATRIIPWNRVEVVHELPEDTQWDVAAEIDENGRCILANKQHTIVTRPQDAK